MAAYVPDTSAVVKRYIQEAGTAWVRSIADPAAFHLIYLACIGALFSALVSSRTVPYNYATWVQGNNGRRRRKDVRGSGFIPSIATAPLVGWLPRHAEHPFE